MKRLAAMAVAGVALAFVISCAGGSVANNPSGLCGTGPACEGGYVCMDGSCLEICTDSCQDPAMTCDNGVCRVLNTQCTEDSGCTTPGNCFVAAGATCTSGKCHYAALTCEQTSPFDPCRKHDGTCNPDHGGGNCSGTDCCEYPAMWDGSGTPPSCPFASQDTDGDGVLDNDETWGGYCTTAGQCGGCTTQAQCDTNNQCTVDSCTGGICMSDASSKLGSHCTIVTADDGVCVTAGNSAACEPGLGQTCELDRDCASHHCSCGNETCTTRVCAQNACICKWAADGTCSQNVRDGFNDAVGCGSITQGCYGGVCLSATGQSCTADNQCGSGHCNCINAACDARVCATGSCPCMYGTAGACTTALTDGDDLLHCTGINTCNSGTCLLKLGQSCGSHGDCSSQHCECTNPTCASRVCATASCVCKYGVGGACTTNLQSGTQDPEDCAIGAQVCRAGVCAKDNGVTCAVDADCGSSNCECINGDCTSHVCAATSCLCRFGSNGTCTTDLNWNTNDVGDCEKASGTACYSGACLPLKTGNGSSCARNADCLSNICVCTAGDCSQSRCGISDGPVCQYCDNWGSDSCAASYYYHDLGSGIADPDRCDSTHLGGACTTLPCACNSGGTCAHQ